jgi:hypothetical protein
MSSKVASLRGDACSWTQAATWSPMRFGRVLPRMIPIVIMATTTIEGVEV